MSVTYKELLLKQSFVTTSHYQMKNKLKQIHVYNIFLQQIIHTVYARVMFPDFTNIWQVSKSRINSLTDFLYYMTKEYITFGELWSKNTIFSFVAKTGLNFLLFSDQSFLSSPVNFINWSCKWVSISKRHVFKKGYTTQHF